ncbi:hypothetical protein DRQ53_12020 [bacterium]|nr:MAG: hypothetical protein DRQ53_12020 [bacterium]
MTGAQIKQARRALKIPRVELAKRLGVSFDTVASWENDRRRPCCEYMRREIARVLKLKR